MTRQKLTLRLMIYGLLLGTFWLGIPQMHYAAALMIAIIIRHKDHPQGLFAPIDSASLGW